MKKLWIYALLICTGFTAYSQVGIGNTNPQAQLDISASNTATPTNQDGILIPRIDDFPVTNPTATQDGMMVFATGNGTPTKGFYYWDNGTTSWVVLSGVADTDWTEVGSDIERQSGDVYIGDNATTNNDLYLSDRLFDWDNSTYFLDLDTSSRINEIQLDNISTIGPSLYFQSDNSSGIGGGVDLVRIYTGGVSRHGFTSQGQLEFFHKQSILIGYNAGNSLSSTFNNSVFIGNNAGQLVTTGLGNNVIGYSVLNVATTASGNNIMGQYAAANITTGSFNTGIGGSVLIDLTTGNNNTAIGSNAGNADVISSNNTYLGYQAGAAPPANNYNRTGNVFLGYTAGYNQNVSNRLFIENSSSAIPLIYGEFDNDIIRINGDLQVNDPSTTGYTFPASDGTANQVMITDGAGQISFADANTLFTNNDWTTTGNAGTNPTTNFIGTTDTQDLSIRTDNTEKVRITTKGQIETTQLQSVWIGENAGDAVTTGSRNVFVGRLSGQLTTTGLDNTAVGGLTLSTNTSGNDNTALGLAALFDLSSGDGNTVIGEQAAENLATGSNNVVLGHLAGENMNGSGNIFLGTFAGQSLTGNNMLVIDNANNGTSSFIYGEMDNEILRANAQVEVTRDSNGTVSHIELEEATANDGARIRFRNAVETTNEWVLYGRPDDTAGEGVFNFFSSEISGNVMRLESDGKVGIMRNPTTNTLEVGGDASKTVAGAWLANSDRRLKKDINKISGKTALDKIQNMRGVTYFWNDDKTGIERPDNLQYGFIAQELMEIFPEKVTRDNLGYYQTAYGDYDPIFVEAIKELKKEMDALKDENQLLKAQLEKYQSLDARLSALEESNKATEKP